VAGDVALVGAWGEDAGSAEAGAAYIFQPFTGLKSDQTISFPAIPDQETTNEVGLAATASSGLDVTFAVGSGPANISGGANLTFTGAGSISIVASQAGDGNWNPAPDVTNTFRVYGLCTVTVHTAYSTATPAGDHVYVEDSIITNTVTSPVESGSTQFVCTGWTSSANEPLAGATNICVMTVTNTTDLTWLWTTNYWLDTEAAPHGTVDVGDGWQPAGVVTIVTAAADQYYHFTNWTGDASGSLNPLDLTIDAPKSVMANFAADLAAHGTPHWWMALHGLTNGGLTFAQAETNNPDADPFDNAQEHIADTAPNDSNDYFCVTAISNNSPVRVSFDSSSNRVYSLQGNESLMTGQWIMVDGATNHTGVGGADSLDDTNAAPLGFYRLSVELP